MGTEIFAKNQRLEPYYVSALVQYKLEFMFRNGHLDIKYRPSRYHMLFALRLLIAGAEMPPVSANKMAGYCKKILEVFTDAANADIYVGVASDVLMTAAMNVTQGSLNRDVVRTEPFTNPVKAAALAHPGVSV